MTYTDPHTIEPGNRDPFTAFITSDTIKDNIETYEFTLRWRDINGNDKSVRVTGDLAQNNALGNVVSNNNGVNSGGGSGNRTNPVREIPNEETAEETAEEETAEEETADEGGG